MFSYYGGKSKIVDYYPPPKFKKIIEPFAGSARYSLKYWDNDVLLLDKYEVIVKIWKWLQQCSEADIKKLPILKQGESLHDYNLTIQEKMFMGFIITSASSGLKNIATKYGAPEIKSRLNNVAKNLYKIRHWQIKEGSYEELLNEEATWFIDPPYQFGGHCYKFGNKKIDYSFLANWCKTRKGQVIVCENTKASWLPFKPMINIRGIKYKTTEAIWSNQRTNYDGHQILLQF